MSTRHHVSLTNSQKMEICAYQQANPSKKQTEIADWTKNQFSLQKAPTQATISNILSKRDKYASLHATKLQGKRQKAVKYPQLDTALANWVLQCEARRISLSADLIVEKARNFASK